MRLPPIFEFSNVSVFHSGVPNEERIVLRPTESVELAQFGIFVAAQSKDGTLTPINDNFFWFGAMQISPPSWIVVYTGKGEFRELAHHTTKHPVYCFHWGREQTIFNFSELVPVVFRINQISTGGHITPPPSYSTALSNAV